MAFPVPSIMVLLAASSMAFGAELSGIWMGQATGRNSEKQDVAFQFKKVNGALSGVMFGDEFDLPVQDLKLEGETISFSVTAANYYSGSRSTTVYTGTVSGKEIQLTRERKDRPVTPPPADRPDSKQMLTLTRVTP